MGVGPKTAVLVPLKPFAEAKPQLGESCTQHQREQLARRLASNVLQSARGLRCVVIASPGALDVQRFALINGARFITTRLDFDDVDAVISHGISELKDLGYERVLVVNADLPQPISLDWLIKSTGVTFVADSTGNGTNAICLPTEIGFPFSLSTPCFDSNQQKAQDLNLESKAVVDPGNLSMNIRHIDDAINAGLLSPGLFSTPDAAAN